MSKKISAEDWVLRANQIHGNKYTYPTELWGEFNNRTLLPILCKEHGLFNQSLTNHTHKSSPTGCPICSGKLLKSTEERIRQSKIVHGDKYDYSLWPDHVNAKTIVTTLCKLCNETWDHNIDNHVRGKGCPNCVSRKANEKSKNNKQKIVERKISQGNEYLNLAKTKHNNKYDYSLIDTIFNVKSLQPVLCPHHGEFFTVFYNHAIRGSECPSCVNEKMRDKHKFGFSKWVDVIGKLKPDLKLRQHECGSHTAKSKVYAFCPTHGEWVTTLFSLKYCGCPSCSGSSQRFLYVNSVENLCLKYGIAVNVERRLSSQNRVNLFNMSTMMLFEFKEYSDCRYCESELKKLLKPVMTKSDLVDGWTETCSFSDIEKIITTVKSFGGVECEL